jgi:hypothetical protein
MIRASSRPGEVPGQRALAVGRGRGYVHFDVHCLVLVLVRRGLEGLGGGQALGRDEVVGEQRLHPSHDEPLPALRGGHRADVASSARVLVKGANVLQLFATPLHETRGVDAPTVVRSEGASMNAPGGSAVLSLVVAFQTFKKNVRIADTSQAREARVDARVLRRAAHIAARARIASARRSRTRPSREGLDAPSSADRLRPRVTGGIHPNNDAQLSWLQRPRVVSARPRPPAESR